MEAASRPVLEPLPDLPVEEAFGLDAVEAPLGRDQTTSPAAGTPSSPPENGVPPVTRPQIEGDEELLAHGILLDLDPESSALPASAELPQGIPVPETRLESGPEGRLESVPAPTPAAPSELTLDPEILLGATEAGAPARVDGTNGPGVTRGTPTPGSLSANSPGQRSLPVLDITKSASSSSPQRPGAPASASAVSARPPVAAAAASVAPSA